METKNLPLTEFQCLLDDLSIHSANHLIEAEADLMQTSFLLGEAIERLTTSFMQINYAIQSQHDAFEKLMQDQAVPTNNIQKFTEFRDQINTEINAVVTGLQFQDLTSQLLARTMKRLNGLRDVLSGLSSEDEHQPTESDHDAVATLLKKVNESLSLRSSALQAGMRQQVTQKHMGSGDIELF
ncbi:MAG: chemotaxis protein [Methylophilaceae bacterium]|nr:chemotaxis protein [Methylophilaceae bacterium]